jgi:hypothetical protein
MQDADLYYAREHGPNQQPQSILGIIPPPIWRLHYRYQLAIHAAQNQRCTTENENLFGILGASSKNVQGNIIGSKNMLRAIADGIDDPEELAGMAQRTLKRKKPGLELALQGYTSPHQRLLLKTILAHIDFLTEQMICWIKKLRGSYVFLGRTCSRPKRKCGQKEIS